MIKNYLKITLRNLIKHKVFSFLNITGLTLGIACSVMILLWVQDELSWNKMHDNLDNIYMAAVEQRFNDGKVSRWGGGVTAFGPAVAAEYPQVQNQVRMLNGSLTQVVRYNDKIFTQRFQVADNSLFEVFTLPFISGDYKNALKAPFSVVITEEVANNFFGAEDPIGKILNFDNKYDFTVTGVMKNIPSNTSLQFEMYVSISYLEVLYNNLDILNRWYDNSFRTYFLMNDGVDHQEFNELIKSRMNRGGNTNDINPFVFPFKDFYLYNLGYGGGKIEQVQIFGLIGIFVLLIACINFMNLTTAKSATRAKEIGMRKVVGAEKKDIILQFFGESILMAFLSLFLALIVVAVILPLFNAVADKELSFISLQNIYLILGVFGITILTGLIAGSYPALYMSGLKPLAVLKESSASKGNKSSFRKILVVVQFSLSIVLVIRTAVVYQQLELVRNTDLGFNKEQILYIPYNGGIAENYSASSNEFKALSEVLNVSASSHVLTGIYTNSTGWGWAMKKPAFDPLISIFRTDYEFPDTYGINMSDGEYFNINNSPEAGNKIVINRKFAEMTEYLNPIGKQITFGSNNYDIIGVINDFNFKPLTSEIEPLALFFSPTNHRYISFKINTNDTQRTLTSIEQVYKKFNPNFPFYYTFLDGSFDRLYRSDQRLGTIIEYFTILAILISFLGLFGVATYMTEQKTKEIGIRKVLGSSVFKIINLFMIEFLKWVVISNIIAMPIAWYLSNEWLQKFAYRIDLNWKIFLVSGLISLLVAILAVGLQTFKAASKNPVTALKYE